MECPDEDIRRIDPTEIVDAIRKCRDALANDNSTQALQSRLANLRSVAVMLCNAFCRLEGATEFWTALKMQVGQRDQSQRADIEALGTALGTLRSPQYEDFAKALIKWGYKPSAHAIAFVDEQMGQLCGAVMALPVSLPRQGGEVTLGSLPSHAQAAVHTMRQQVCGGEENYENEAARKMLRGKIGDIAIKSLIEIIKKKLGVLFGFAMIFASCKPDFYDGEHEPPSMNEEQAALLLLGLMCVVFNGMLIDLNAVA